MTRPAVLVTGGAKRVGAAIAEGFAKAGWHVVIHYHRSAREATDLAAGLPSAETVQCELSDPGAVEEMVAVLSARLLDWRCCVANAALFLPDDAAALDEDLFDRLLTVNARASARLIQLYLAHAYAAQGRRAIAITDQKLFNPNPDFFSYTLTKAALAGAVPLLAMGAAREADRVYALAPGAILPSHDQNAAEAEVSHRLNLLQRRTSAGEIADGCVFLAQGLLASGETLLVDSGQHLLRQARDVIYLARDEPGARPA
ncbi:SDR family oxidoreductase [Porphyrobacter sp. GA68]|uniref:SDR family oxidoreductase n=1 Tax=Porphyrobacter sp. GA68 TaxID=2883480 RepID=UPI001D192BD7|nr:SDR family oxidoreductase [Porphyrobacter sp. GA68]